LIVIQILCLLHRTAALQARRVSVEPVDKFAWEAIIGEILLAFSVRKGSQQLGLGLQAVLMSGRSSSFAPYRNALKAISLRTGTPLSTLIISFGILHELTAIAPLVGIFYGSRALGIGERAVNIMVREDPEEGGGGGGLGWLRGKFRGWVEEGDRWAKRVGTRYGIFGFPKSPSSPPNPGQHQNESARESSGDNGASQRVSERIAGDVANAVVAYAITKVRL
jgi:Hypothetical protein FLILHELTA